MDNKYENELDELFIKEFMTNLDKPDFIYEKKDDLYIIKYVGNNENLTLATIYRKAMVDLKERIDKDNKKS